MVRKEMNLGSSEPAFVDDLLEIDDHQGDAASPFLWPPLVAIAVKVSILEMNFSDDLFFVPATFLNAFF